MQKNYYGKGFTLMEILIVIVLIGIVGGIGLRYISTGNYTKQQQFGVKCGMYLTEEIENFVDAARKSSGIITNTTGKKITKIYPNKYKISFGRKAINFSYSSGNQHKFTSYRGNQLNEFDCKDNTYNIELNTTSSSLSMNEGFMGNKPGEISTFKRTGESGDIILKSCKGKYCIETYKFSINVAAQKIRSSICRSYKVNDGESTNKCKKRR